MPSAQAKILDTKINHDGWLLAKVRFNRVLPNKGEMCRVKWGSSRTTPQNALYWKYLRFLIKDCGLEEMGHFDPEALHLDLKSRLLAEKRFDKGKMKSIEEPTTTLLSKSEFTEYLHAVDMFVREFFEIDTGSFWEEYDREWR